MSDFLTQVGIGLGAVTIATILFQYFNRNSGDAE